ncbi:MAG TPA: zinc-dependent metalloprotease [Steroidobacteraceae bacterium]|nr:zinc-dependent metalloprotease [Steroidobacteraceae bacterium]
MRRWMLLLVVTLAACDTAEPPLSQQLAGYEKLDGFIDMYWDDSTGRLLLAIEDFNKPFLYQSSLARGVGSNDLFLDRGQLGATRLVEFDRSGPKVLLVEQNLGFRADSSDAAERRAVEESFARSTIWGFESMGNAGGAVIVDATAFLTRDAHGISARLRAAGEGEYAADPTRSAIYLPRTKVFPDNSEAEAIVTFTGQPTGKYLPTVTPDPTTVSVHLHHSFIRLPDDGYEPLPFDPRAGFFGFRTGSSNGFLDYASTIGEQLAVNYAARHRLQKKDPAADISEPVEPIVYYVDRGAPEPVRSALVEGASWWNQAFEAAGYRDAFRVELLPEGADPMDVRYNVIQWVHRSTRGWSYGASVADPRTNEIIKGHVTLGSLRVRQDFLLAEGLLAPYEDENVPPGMLEMSLARIRQLSAHEVGHTLGVAHNFAASTQDRASVMDYPYPLVRIDEEGGLDLADAYDTGIGEWDKRAVLWGYQDFPEGTDANAERETIMAETLADGWKFVADADSRDIGSAHPDGNLWDNGADAIEELEHLLQVREIALGRFAERNIRIGRPLATLEEVLVPLYLLHRYQLEAVGKLLGGQAFTYALRGDGQAATTPVDASRQRAALIALLRAVDPDVLRLPDKLIASIPVRPPGFERTRENFPRDTGIVFDPYGPAQSAVALTLDVLLEPTRAARMIAGNAGDAALPGFGELSDALLRATWFSNRRSGADAEIQRLTNRLVLERLLILGADQAADAQVRAIAFDAVSELDRWLESRIALERDAQWRAHYRLARHTIERVRHDPAALGALVPVVPPPGSPIGANTRER